MKGWPVSVINDRRAPPGSGGLAAPAVAGQRTPSHGHGRLRVGNPGNKGGGRPRNAVRRLVRDLGAAAAEEILRRMSDPEMLAALTTDELRRIMADAMRIAIGTPMRVKLDGSGSGGAIPVAVIGPSAALPAAPRAAGSY